MAGTAWRPRSTHGRLCCMSVAIVVAVIGALLVERITATFRTRVLRRALGQLRSVRPWGGEATTRAKETGD